MVIMCRREMEQVKIWPMPKEVKYGRKSFYLGEDFKLVTKHDDSSGILKEEFDRMFGVVKMSHVVAANLSGFAKSNILQGLHIVISSPNDEVFPLLFVPFLFFFR